MNKRRDFYDLMKQKLLRAPDRAFDQAFWTNFEKEFGKKARPWFSWFSMRFMIPTAVAALLLITVFTTLKIQQRSPLPSHAVMVGEIFENRELLGDLDLFLEFEDLPVDEEEWDELFKEVEES